MKYSILIPCYKQELTIRSCLDSVLAQEICDWEAICTDDGSPDRTGEILDDYVRSHCQESKEFFTEHAGENKRIFEGRCFNGGLLRVIHQKNKGMSGARNTAKNFSSGEWYINLDGDDLLAPDALKTIDKGLEFCPDADMIRGGFRRFNHGSEPQWSGNENDFRVIDMSSEIKSGVVVGGFQSMIFRRYVCGDIMFEGQNWSEERLYTARCLVKVRTCLVVPQDIYGYREHPGQFTKHGMTLDECIGYFDSTRLILETFLRSQRSIAPELTRSLILKLIEWQPRFIVNSLSDIDKKVAWNHWFSSVGQIVEYPCISLWCKVVAYICAKTRLKWVAMILCYFPDWLKRCGLHR